MSRFFLLAGDFGINPQKMPILWEKTIGEGGFVTDSAKKWAWIGAGTAAATALAGVSLTLSCRYLVQMAMDRQTPKRGRRELEKVSGEPENRAVMAMAQALGERLASSGCQRIVLKSHDGLRLVGHWRPCPEPKRVIVAMHGWRSNWARDFGMIADFWYRNGCSVLYAEQRGQGESDGEYIGFGMLERRDCLQWSRWAAEQEPELPLYLAGVSMGAATVLMAGGMELPPQTRGIMADCGFTSPHAIWRHVARNNLHLHYDLYATAAGDLCRKKIRMSPEDYSTLDAMAECEVPVLFIHGTEDAFVPISMTYENYKACTAPKRLLVVPGAGHGLSYCTERERYEKTMLEFFRDFDQKA